MHFQIDNSSKRPVYQQIIDQVRRDIALGRLKKGEKLPTVRQLASLLLINPNTIARAYRQLEQDNIIVTKPGSGAFVAELNSNLSGAVRKKIIFRQLELLMVDVVQMRIDKRTMTDWFNQTLDRFKIA